MRDPDYPAASVSLIGASWTGGGVLGTGSVTRLLAPSVATTSLPPVRARFERLAVSPAGIKALLRIIQATDARHVLPVVRVPTLIVHRGGDRVARVEGARYIAERIPGAKYVELPGPDHFPWVGDTDAVLDEVEEFVTGTAGSRRIGSCDGHVPTRRRTGGPSRWATVGGRALEAITHRSRADHPVPAADRTDGDASCDIHARPAAFAAPRDRRECPPGWRRDGLTRGMECSGTVSGVAIHTGRASRRWPARRGARSGT